MTAEITPPPAQPLHLVLWRGLEPGYYLVLGAAFLGGFAYVLLDVSWGRLLLAIVGLLVLIVLVLPYHGMRLWKWGWLRLGHWWAVLLASVHPVRRRQVAALTSRLLEAAPPKAQHASVARTGGTTGSRAFPASLDGDTPDWDPAWTAAWRTSTARPSHSAPRAASAPEVGARLSLPAAQLAQDELDGMPASSLATPAATPEERTGGPLDPSALTLRQIRAWSSVSLTPGG